MAAALTMKNVWKGSAAAEHGTNIAFANMDWKSGRHTGRNRKDHHAIWQRTTIETVPRSDWAMLQNHWDGSDVRLVREIQEQGGDRRFKMPPLWNNLAHTR